MTNKFLNNFYLLCPRFLVETNRILMCSVNTSSCLTTMCNSFLSDVDIDFMSMVLMLKGVCLFVWMVRLFSYRCLLSDCAGFQQTGLAHMLETASKIELMFDCQRLFHSLRIVFLRQSFQINGTATLSNVSLSTDDFRVVPVELIRAQLRRFMDL